MKTFLRELSRVIFFYCKYVSATWHCVHNALANNCGQNTYGHINIQYSAIFWGFFVFCLIGCPSTSLRNYQLYIKRPIITIYIWGL